VRGCCAEEWCGIPWTACSPNFLKLFNCGWIHSVNHECIYAALMCNVCHV
jgi:hypothetical protein